MKAHNKKQTQLPTGTDHNENVAYEIYRMISFLAKIEDEEVIKNCITSNPYMHNISVPAQQRKVAGLN